ncbi:MAG: hypothetical protein ACR2LL_04350 [Nitrosopumilus sp.]
MSGPIEQDEMIIHHKEYVPEEKIVSIHKICLLEINCDWNYSSLKPPRDAIDDYYGEKNFKQS